MSVSHTNIKLANALGLVEMKLKLLVQKQEAEREILLIESDEILVPGIVDAINNGHDTPEKISKALGIGEALISLTLEKYSKSCVDPTKN